MNTLHPSDPNRPRRARALRVALAGIVGSLGLVAIPGTAQAADNVTCPDVTTDIHIRTSIADTDFPDIWVNSQFGANKEILSAGTTPMPADPRDDSYDNAPALPTDVQPISLALDSWKNKYEVWIDRVEAAGTTSSMDFRTGTVITVDGNDFPAGVFSGDTDRDRILDPDETWVYVEDFGSNYTSAETSGGPIVRTDNSLQFTDSAGEPLTCPGRGGKRDAAEANPLPPSFEIGNYVWLDADGDGIQDSDESGIPNVKLTLTRTDGQPVVDADGAPYSGTVVYTDSMGMYSFPALSGSGIEYRVTVTPPSGHQATLAGVGDPETDSSTGSATTLAMAFGMSAQDLSLDFGFVKSAAVIATPANPDVSAQCGPNNDTVWAAVTKGITYTVGTWSNNTLTVSATWEAGYTRPSILPAGWTLANGMAFYQVTDANVACPIPVAPVAPTVTPTCGANNDTVTLATTTGITYSMSTWSGNVRTISARWNAGYTIPPAMPAGWVLDNRGATYRVTDQATDCPVATPVAPTTEVVCGADNDEVTVIGTEGVSYSLSPWSGGTSAVTASLDPGYIWPTELPAGWTANDDGTASYALTDEATECPAMASPVAPTVEVVCGADNDSIGLSGADGVSYSPSEWTDGQATVTASLEPGYIWPTELPDGWTANDDGTASYALIDEATECPAVASPVAPTVEVVCGADNDEVTTPRTDGISYVVGDWSQGSAVVTASLAAGTEWPETLPAGWTANDDGTASYALTDDDTVCEDVSPDSDGDGDDDGGTPDNGTSPEAGDLPETGASVWTTGATTVGLLSLLAGLGLLLARRRLTGTE